jgi:PTH1 family peptidyl-tRNA hydrolase
MKLIVGLGNPGAKYADTRHNVGWRVAEELARRTGAGAWKEKFGGRVAQARVAGRRLAILEPLGFMNCSGAAVRQAADFWKVEPADLLVVLDDMNLELGRLRLRASGSDGGHNGLASVMEHLGHGGFARLRAGIGPAPPIEQHVDFVLSPFRAEERPAVDRMIEEAADAAECWLRDGLQEAMNRFNGPAQGPANH